VLTKNLIGIESIDVGSVPLVSSHSMLAPLVSVFAALCSSFRTRATLQLEILALRHQVNVLRRSQRGRVRLTSADRLFWTWLMHLWSGWRSALAIVKPETVIAWHREGFRLYWTWKSRHREPGRPEIVSEIRDLVRKMRLTNPLWGAPRFHGELLKLGIEVSQATVAKYMARGRRPPSLTWRTFLNNYVKELVSTDFFSCRQLAFEFSLSLLCWLIIAGASSISM
jgi:putative transposase